MEEEEQIPSILEGKGQHPSWWGPSPPRLGWHSWTCLQCSLHCVFLVPKHIREHHLLGTAEIIEEKLNEEVLLLHFGLSWLNWHPGGGAPSCQVPEEQNGHPQKKKPLIFQL